MAGREKGWLYTGVRLGKIPSPRRLPSTTISEMKTHRRPVPRPNGCATLGLTRWAIRSSARGAAVCLPAPLGRQQRGGWLGQPVIWLLA